MLLKSIGALRILLMTSCSSFRPLPITRLPEGNVKRLMKLHEFQDIKDAGDNVKRWATEALHTINDLEFQLRIEDE